MTKKPSLGEYEALAKELSFLCFRLSALACKLGQETGVSRKPYQFAREAAQALDKCKSETENLMFLQYPGLPDEAVTIFYREPESHQDKG